MKKIRFYSKSPLAIFANVVLILVLNGCTPHEQVIVSKDISGRDIVRAIYFLDGPLASYIPEVSENISLESIYSDPIELKRTRQVVDEVLNFIDLKEPTLFSTIKKDMTSGDHIIVEQSLSYHSELIFELVLSMHEENDLLIDLQDNNTSLVTFINEHFPSDSREEQSIEEISNKINDQNFKNYVSLYFEKVQSENGRQEEPNALILFAAAIAIVAIYVIAVLEAIYLWTDYDVDWDDGVVHPITQLARSADNNLLKEQLINSIATNFAQ